MNLLVFTQKIDKQDPVLGFFHEWVKRMSLHFDVVYVICLYRGGFDLPQNVKVFSLGKEENVGKLVYVWRFFKYAFFSKIKYQKVLVHMNQEYVLLGGIFWKILGKTVYLWRNHPKGGLLTRLSVLLSEKVFYTSPQSFTAQFKKGVLMPVGINTDFFNPNDRNDTKNSVLSLGRISPIKKVDEIIEAVKVLDDKNVDVLLDVVGDPVNPDDGAYLENLVTKHKSLIDKGKLNFIPGVPGDGALLMFKNHRIFVNMTPSGSMDKTILEAASCGALPIVRNQYFRKVLGENMIAENAEELSKKINYWTSADPKIVNETQEKLREYVVENHSLSKLMEKLMRYLKNNIKE